MLPLLCPSALAEFDEPKRSTFIMFGVLTIAVRIYHDRWGYGVYSGPIGTAVLVITVRWVRGAGGALWGAPAGERAESMPGISSSRCSSQSHSDFSFNLSRRQTAASAINARFDRSEQSTTSAVPAFLIRRNVFMEFLQLLRGRGIW